MKPELYRIQTNKLINILYRLYFFLYSFDIIKCFVFLLYESSESDVNLILCVLVPALCGKQRRTISPTQSSEGGQAQGRSEGCEVYTPLCDGARNG